MLFYIFHKYAFLSIAKTFLFAEYLTVACTHGSGAGLRMRGNPESGMAWLGAANDDVDCNKNMQNSIEIVWKLSLLRTLRTAQKGDWGGNIGQTSSIVVS